MSGLFISKDPSPQKKNLRDWAKFLGLGDDSWVSFFGWALFILLFRTAFFCPYKIPSGSMIPTLLVGDHIIVSRYPYGLCRFSFLGSQYINYFSGRIFQKALPKRGDVVVFTAPDKIDLDYVKRCVGLPGDKIQMIGGYLYINGKKLNIQKVQENYIDHDGYGEIKGDLYEEEIPVASVEKNENTVEKGEIKKHLVMKQKAFGDHDVDNTPVHEVPKDCFFFMGDNRDGSSDGREFGSVHKDFLLGPAEVIFWSVNEHIHLWKPWTWFTLIQNTRWKRLPQKIQ